VRVFFLWRRHINTQTVSRLHHPNIIQHAGVVREILRDMGLVKENMEEMHERLEKATKDDGH
jgi:hypothetical protein